MIRNTAPNNAPQPRFSIGESVMVRSAIDPARNTDCTAVIDRQWFEGMAAAGWYCGWQYVVSIHPDAWAMESSIKPRPKPSALSWNDLSHELSHETKRDLIPELQD